MLSKYKNLQIANAVYTSTSGLLAYYSNPKNQGPNFSWEHFSTIASLACYGTVLANVRCTKKNTKEVFDTASKMAIEIGEHLIKKMENE